MISELAGKIYRARKKRSFGSFQSEFPKQIDVETTNVCNLRCTICPQPQQTRKIGYLNLAVAKKIIDEVAIYGLERMCLSLFGEPFLNKDFFDISRYAKKSNKIDHLYISTNALLMDERISRELIDSGLDKIIISIDGASKETYEKIRVGGDYDKLISNVENFIRIREASGGNGPRIAVQIIRMKETDKEVDKFYKFWQDKINQTDQIDVKEHFTWAKKVEGSGVESAGKIAVKVPCLTYLWSNMAIYWNGDMTVCCYDSDADLVIGNINENSIHDVWHSEKYNNLRQKHLEGMIDELPLCKDCELSHRRFGIGGLLKGVFKK